MILDTIVTRKKEEVRTLLAKGWKKPEDEISGPRGFRQAVLSSDGVAIIAEAKKASPSKGVICPDFDPVQIARDYQAGGAQAISVLTDEDFFQGNISYIPMVREAVRLPVLRKDFIIHECQIQQAADYGADAVLLIAAILETAQMRDYMQMASELGMDVLMEAHDEAEAEAALKAEGNLIGINNRNLNDFSVDMETTFRVMKLIPEGIPVVSESGIRNRNDILRLGSHGVCAALIGETLMRNGNRINGLRELLGIE
jgi:indole-3-glycerol phosphate synthase